MRIFTGSTISFQSNGFHTVDSSHPKFDEICEAAFADDYEGADKLLDVKKAVDQMISGSAVSLVGDTLFFEGEVVSGLLGERILEMSRMGLSVTPLVAFLGNLRDNPSSRAAEELYGFLEVSRLPITEDGHFLAYKSVKQDYTDHHSGTISNKVGEVISMTRNKVNEDKDQTCSYGLHFAAHEYAEGFGSSGRMMVMKINPRDVVSIPSDYSNQKGRCCKYEVIEEVERSDRKLVGAQVVNTAPPIVSPASPDYSPQVDNYSDDDIFDPMDLEFWGDADEFPVNRKSTYDLHRESNGKTYGDYFFTNYNEDTGSLVFRKHNGLDFDYVTICDLDDWTIFCTEVVLGS